MRRVINYFDWKVKWWLDQAHRCTDIPLAVQRGLVAYAAKQAETYRSLAMSFAGKWYPFLVYKGLPVE